MATRPSTSRTKASTTSSKVSTVSSSALRASTSKSATSPIPAPSPSPARLPKLSAAAQATLNRPGTTFMRKTEDAELAFVRRYIVDFNGTRAVMECGAFQVASYSGAAVHASRLLSRPRVKQMVQDALAERAKRWQVTGDRIIRELARTGFSNMLDYLMVQPDGSAYIDLKKLAELREHDPDAAYDLGAAIQEVTSEVYLEGNGEDAIPVKRTKLRLHNKQAALELLGKHLGLFVEPKGTQLPPQVTFNVVYVQDQGRNAKLQADLTGDSNGSNGNNNGHHST